MAVSQDKTAGFYGRLRKPAKTSCIVLSKNAATGEVALQQYGKTNAHFRSIVLDDHASFKADQIDHLLDPNNESVDFRMTCRTPETGTQMACSRSYPMSVKNVDGSASQHRVLVFSPISMDLRGVDESSLRKENKNRKRRTKVKTESKAKQENSKAISTNDMMGNEVVTLTSANHPIHIRKALPTQMKVMGNSANSELKREVERLENVVTPEMMKQGVQQSLDALESNKKQFDDATFLFLKEFVQKYAMEWLHCYAVSLSPAEMNPQSPKNLACGPKWINSSMMIFEAIASYLAKHNRDLTINICPLFKMIAGTKIIKKVHYDIEVLMAKPNKRNDPKGVSNIKLSSRWNALALPSQSNWASSTDYTHLFRVLDAVMQGEAPRERMVVSVV